MSIFTYDLLSGMPGLVNLDVVVSPFAYTIEHRQVRFPRSKKIRMRKKWAKQARNYHDISKPAAYLIGNTILCHPLIADQIKKACR